jgi:hypothetical protein
MAKDGEAVGNDDESLDRFVQIILLVGSFHDIGIGGQAQIAFSNDLFPVVSPFRGVIRRRRIRAANPPMLGPPGRGRP